MKGYGNSPKSCWWKGASLLIIGVVLGPLAAYAAAHFGLPAGHAGMHTASFPSFLAIYPSTLLNKIYSWFTTHPITGLSSAGRILLDKQQKDALLAPTDELTAGGPSALPAGDSDSRPDFAPGLAVPRLGRVS